MVKVSFYGGVKTRHVYGWVLIIGLASAVSVAVGAGVELTAISSVLARCGDDVLMACKTSTNQPDIKYFAWEATNIMCKYEDPRSDSGFLCESMETPVHRLTLTLLNVMPVNQGNYICKLRSKLGADSTTTVVTIQDCIGSSNASINKDQAMCWFSGVYPSGVVHWFQGDVNLTESARTQEEKDQDGRYNISSTIDVQKGNQNQPYKCSLWIPSTRTILSDHELFLVESQVSSGSMVKLQWIFLMVEIMMVKCMT